ncbi:MAG TPA: tRNA uridine-5-carboxymethylaminomethyl(34) synthesis enzyme MnmG [Fimbriimonadaceae bacterium]|nr:tRNA uridine-5-carboxymethylaminomethyl(34) synthesis enzyme MnmG [Fimbriimonadaceae bacterium]
MERFDVIVVGAGHAGIETALAAARLGRKTACITLRLDRIGHLPCNCSIGGPAKGHMAREVDALGGQMGVTTDYAVTHIRRVGTGRGPAVQTLRAHVCKELYPRLMRQALEQTAGLALIEETVETLLTVGGRIAGVELGSGSRLEAPAVVLTTGTFLNGLCHEGKVKTRAARLGEPAVAGLSEFLAGNGHQLRRFKTGTTPRVRLSSLDLAACEHMGPEPEAGAFSFKHDALRPRRSLLSCWQTWTNAETHAVIMANLSESAMYSGAIQGVGPRYCPSVEDKVVRFAEKEHHPIFLEVETWDGEEVYVQGVSTSLPATIQLELLRTVPGMRNVEMLRPGYAVEYDMADPLGLTPHLMSKSVPGLFLAGQINGTSGYEEAAGQGIVAGINAARYAAGEPPVDFPRQQSFIGVMVDDLVTKGVDDPYRMLTARAEHRLTLRSDNADTRLTPLAREVGLCDDERWRRFEAKHEAIQAGRAALEAAKIHPGHNAILDRHEICRVEAKVSLFELMRRPDIGMREAVMLADACKLELELTENPEARTQIELAAKYSGYLLRQESVVSSAVQLEAIKIPTGFDFAALHGLSYESREKLGRIKPTSVGQASRVPGVRPSDIALLMGHLKRTRPENLKT